jgi:hypothetical protein
MTMDKRAVGPRPGAASARDFLVFGLFGGIAPTYERADTTTDGNAERPVLCFLPGMVHVCATGSSTDKDAPTILAAAVAEFEPLQVRRRSGGHAEAGLAYGREQILVYKQSKSDPVRAARRAGLCSIWLPVRAAG